MAVLVLCSPVSPEAILAKTTATILVPARSADAITESGKPLAKASGVKSLRMEGDRAVLEVEEGSYRFGSGIGRQR